MPLKTPMTEMVQTLVLGRGWEQLLYRCYGQWYFDLKELMKPNEMNCLQIQGEISISTSTVHISKIFRGKCKTKV